MEVDEGTPRKVEPMEMDLPSMPVRVQSASELTLTEDFFHFTVGKVLGLSLKGDKNVLSLSDVCGDHPLVCVLAGHVNFHKEVVGDLIFEALDLICGGNVACRCLFESSSPINCLQYLIDCYNRAESHEKKYSKRCSIPESKDLLNTVRSSLCSSILLLLGGVFTENQPKDYYEILYGHLKTHSLPTGMLYEAVQQSESDQESFDQLFSPLMFHIRRQAINSSISDSCHRESLSVLTDLCEFRTVSSSRPFCNLMIRLKNWLVEPITEAVGREFAKLTYLGPFLCTSLFAEDDPSMVDKIPSTTTGSSPESNRPIVLGLQQEIELTRNSLHKVHTLISNLTYQDNCLLKK